MPTEIPGILSHQEDCQLRALRGKGEPFRKVLKSRETLDFMCACTWPCRSKHTPPVGKGGTAESSQPHLCISENRATFFLNSGPHPLFIQSLVGPDLYQALGTSSVLGRGCLLCCRGGVSLRTNTKSETQVVNQTVLGLGFHPRAQPCISCFHDRASSHHTLQRASQSLRVLQSVTRGTH